MAKEKSDYKAKFDLSDDIAYLNCAYMGPLPNATVAAGEAALRQLARPYQIGPKDFFEPVTAVRTRFARLISAAEPARIAVTPSASYGIANAARQIRPRKGSTIIVPAGQFPSNVYAWRQLCADFGCTLLTVPAPPAGDGRGRRWSQALLEAIDDRTAVLALAPLNWTDGTLFDLQALRAATRAHNALLIVDGSQWIGAQPFDVEALQPDALIVAGYKWLLSPYGSGFAWYGGFFDDGVPIEQNWITRKDSDNFREMLNYDREMRPVGMRFSSGQHPAQAQIAMQAASLAQLLEWDVTARLPQHVTALQAPYLDALREMGYWLEAPEFRAGHLFGIYAPPGVDPAALQARLRAAGVIVSLYGNVLRVSLHLFNDESQVARLVEVLKSAYLKGTTT